jgi:hypothetical protein
VNLEFTNRLDWLASKPQRSETLLSLLPSTGIFFFFKSKPGSLLDAGDLTQVFMLVLSKHCPIPAGLLNEFLSSQKKKNHEYIHSFTINV